MATLETSNFITVGERLKSLRKERTKLGYRKFSHELGVEPKHYWNLENDKTNWSKSSIKMILDYYEISAEEFFKGVQL